jgi:hypothetical protein
MPCPDCKPALHKTPDGRVLLWPKDYKREIDRLETKNYNLCRVYEKEIEKWKSKLAIARKERLPMTARERAIAAVSSNVVGDVVMLCTYGSLFGSMNAAMQVCAGIAMCIVGIAGVILGWVFVD